MHARKKSNDQLAFVYYPMEKKLTKCYPMTSHVIAYRSAELLFGTYEFNFDCFLVDFNCIFTQLCWLSVLLPR